MQENVATKMGFSRLHDFFGRGFAWRCLSPWVMEDAVKNSLTAPLDPAELGCGELRALRDGFTFVILTEVGFDETAARDEAAAVDLFDGADVPDLVEEVALLETLDDEVDEDGVVESLPDGGDRKSVV